MQWSSAAVERSSVAVEWSSGAEQRSRAEQRISSVAEQRSSVAANPRIIATLQAKVLHRGGSFKINHGIIPEA